MNRRSFSVALSGGVALAVPGAGSGMVFSVKAAPPNVLFISVDDLNDWLGCLGGHPDALTPNIDALARRGVLFSNAHCPAPCCGPSRAAILTGVAPWNSGIYWNENKLRNSPELYNVKTLPQLFSANGYSVSGSGKIFHDLDHEAASWPEYWPSKSTPRLWPLMPPIADRPLNGVTQDSAFDWGAIDQPVEDMADWQVTDWIIQQLDTPGRNPFFLACGFFKPHLPWYLPQEYFDRFPLEEIDLPEYVSGDLDDIPAKALQVTYWMDAHQELLDVGGEESWRKGVQAMLASISFVDDCVGRVVDALDRSQYADNTVIVLWGDHGQHCGEKERWSKYTGWEETTHTPLIVVAPGVTKPGGVCDQPVNLVNLYPTLAEICNQAPQHDLDGASLVPLLKDPHAEWVRPCITTLAPRRYSLRTKRWRYISYEDGSEELYDHDSDPNEWNNLSGNSAYADLKTELSEWLPAANAAPAPVRVPYSSKVISVDFYKNSFPPVDTDVFFGLVNDSTWAEVNPQDSGTYNFYNLDGSTLDVETSSGLTMNGSDNDWRSYPNFSGVLTAVDQDAVVTLREIPYDAYCIIVYLSGWGAPYKGKITDGTTTRYFDFLSVLPQHLVESTDADSSDGVDPGSYVVFGSANAPLTSDTFTLTVSKISGAVAVGGFQVVGVE